MLSLFLRMGQQHLCHLDKYGGFYSLMGYMHLCKYVCKSHPSINRDTAGRIVILTFYVLYS